MVSEIQIRGEFHLYKERVNTKNKLLALITIALLFISTFLAVYSFFLSPE